MTATTNQIIAMLFPLVTAAAVFVTGLFIRKPWAEKRRQPLPPITSTLHPEVDELLGQAINLIQRARQELKSGSEPT